MSDTVGGRYSLWSAMGLSIALTIGMPHFKALLQGAHAMDQHFRQTDFEHNLPVLLALIGVWYNNFLHYHSHALLVYHQHLQYFPSYIQQLDMESNGKITNRHGKRVTYPTSPVIWGGVGTNGQHTYHQHYIKAVQQNCH